MMDDSDAIGDLERAEIRRRQITAMQFDIRRLAEVSACLFECVAELDAGQPRWTALCCVHEQRTIAKPSSMNFSSAKIVRGKRRNPFEKLLARVKPSRRGSTTPRMPWRCCCQRSYATPIASCHNEKLRRLKIFLRLSRLPRQCSSISRDTASARKIPSVLSVVDRVRAPATDATRAGNNDQAVRRSPSWASV